MHRLVLRLSVLVGVLCIAGNTAFAIRSAEVLTLDDCIRLALERNQKLKGESQAVEAARSQFDEVNAVPWPILDYHTRTAPVPTDVSDSINSFFAGQISLFNSLHVGLSVPITTFGQIKEAKALARGGIEAAQLGLEKEQESTIVQVKQLYYGIQLAHEVEDLIGQAIEEISDKIKEQTTKETPDLSPITLLKLKSFKNELERRQAETVQNRELAEDGLRVQIALPPDDVFVLESYILKPVTANLTTPEEYQAEALSHRLDAKLVDVGVATRERQYRLEKLKLLPIAGVGIFTEVGATTSDIRGLVAKDDFNDPFNFMRAGVGLQIEGKIDFHGAAARIRKAHAEYLKALYERDIARRGLALESQKIFLTAKRSQEDVLRAEEAQRLAGQMLFLAKSNLDIGVGEKDDYIDALQRLLLTRGQYYQSVFQYNVSLAELERAVGSDALTTLASRPGAPVFGSGSEQTEEEGKW